MMFGPASTSRMPHAPVNPDVSARKVPLSSGPSIVPLQVTRPSSLRIPQMNPLPTAMARKLPVGGVAPPSPNGQPQQRMFPPGSRAQAWQNPTEIASKIPVGGSVGNAPVPLQHASVPSSSMPQRKPPALRARNFASLTDGSSEPGTSEGGSGQVTGPPPPEPPSLELPPEPPPPAAPPAPPSGEGGSALHDDKRSMPVRSEQAIHLEDRIQGIGSPGPLSMSCRWLNCRP